VNFKRLAIMVAAALALVACGSLAVGKPVARVDNVILSREELDKRIDRAQKVSQSLAEKQGQPAPTAQDIERRLVGQFVQQNLILSLARARGVAISDNDVDGRIAQIRQGIQSSQSGITLEDAIQSQLGLPSADSTEFRQFISSLVAQGRIAETLVTTDTVRQQLTTQMMTQASQKVDQAHAAHILVETEDDAKKVLDRLAKGEQFEALAKELSKDPGSAPNGGDLGWLQKGQTVPEFDKAIFEDLKPGETTKTAVKTQFGFHIIKLLERDQRAAMTEEQAKQAVEQGIPGELQNQRGQALQKLLADEHDSAKKAGRLDEPDYAEPTAQPAPGGAPQPTPQP
jgi:peptidyl-prolyl cis-trans isomerase C